MGNCLLFGNGINRSYGGLSWQDLLSRIAEKYFVSRETVDSGTLAFEQIKNSVLSMNINVRTDEFASSVLEENDSIDKLEYFELYMRFLSLDISEILTTNFDYGIEKSLIEKEFNRDKLKRAFYQERKCSKKRHTIVGDKKIYHIHGELGIKGTVCLGNVHYAENLNSLMNALLDYDKDHDSYNLKERVFERDLISWAQFFFSENIYIVGLGLYECDMDLWWLISYRSQLIIEGKTEIKNRIYYFYLYDGEKNQGFVDCLKAMNITVLENPVEAGWVKAYQNVADRISEILRE